MTNGPTVLSRQHERSVSRGGEPLALLCLMLWTCLTATLTLYHRSAGHLITVCTPPRSSEDARRGWRLHGDPERSIQPAPGSLIAQRWDCCQACNSRLCFCPPVAQLPEALLQTPSAPTRWRRKRRKASFSPHYKQKFRQRWIILN